jgi:peptidoglycan hydrolase-like protein with peptidoglycan-binding domain
MIRIFLIIFIILISLSILNPQTRDYLNENIQKLFFKEARLKVKEKELIGSTDIYSPRVEEIQNILKETGFFKGRVDGLMGSSTRQAIKIFQKTKGLNPTGIIDTDTYSFLLKEREEQLALKNLKLEQQPSILEKTPSLEKSKEEILKIAGPQKEEKIISSKEKAKLIQIALKKAGFYTGAIDGKIGPKTIKAIKAFQRKNNLKVDGIVGKNTWEKLKVYWE